MIAAIEKHFAAETKAERWISVTEQMPPPHTHVWCLNRGGRQFEGAPCYGMHTPFFTIPHGDGSPSNTAPAWIDVTHWRPLPQSPVKSEGGHDTQVKASGGMACAGCVNQWPLGDDGWHTVRDGKGARFRCIRTE